jgi:stringent starvation protein B
MTPARKRIVLQDALSRGLVHVFIDGSAPGVIVPEDVRKTNLVLALSWMFKVRIDLDDDAIRARLSFSGVNHDVVVPWSALAAVSTDDLCETTSWPVAKVAPVRLAPPTPAPVPVARLLRSVPSGGDC